MPFSLLIPTKLHKMTAIQQIAQEIGITSSYLSSILRRCDRQYKAYYITKSSGDLRQIEAPNESLKAIQRWILRNILETIPVNERAQGFVKGRGIEKNARYHLGRRYLLSIDIKGFFPSVTRDKVYDVFLQATNNADVSQIYSILCTFRNRLPQGGVTSPALSNLVFRPVDEKIVDLCSRINITYSRYADDMTFASNDFQALKDLYENVNNVIISGGYALNKQKTRYCSGKNRMIVTGLRLNSGRLTTGRDRKRRIRAALYNHIVKRDQSVNVNEVLGNVAFIRSVEPDYHSKIEAYVCKLRTKCQYNDAD